MLSSKRLGSPCTLTLSQSVSSLSISDVTSCMFRMESSFRIRDEESESRDNREKRGKLDDAKGRESKEECERRGGGEGREGMV